MSKNEISRVVTSNFLRMIEEIVRKGIYEDIKNESDLAVFTNISHSSISRLKTDENRYVTLEMILRTVNRLGANSNNLFVTDENQKEDLIREKFINSSRTGNTNNITNSKVKSFIQGPVINGDHYKGDINTYQRIINNIPVKYRKEFKDMLQSVNERNENLENQVKDLKKTLAQHDKAIKSKESELMKKEKEIDELKKKERELNEISKKYILLLEERKTVSKR